MKCSTEKQWNSPGQRQSFKKSSRSIENLGRVVAGVAHEIRNPLNTLSLLIYSLRQELTVSGSFPKAFDYITQMEEVVQQVNSIVKNFIQATRPIVTNLKIVNLRQLLIETLQQFQLAFPQISVTLSGDPDVTCTTDPVLLQHIFWNLWLNSFQADSRKIRISVIRERSKVLIKVQDDGKGIPSSILPGLFAPGNTARPEGPGMGLYNCFRMVTAILGAIRGKNGKTGAQFILVIPRPVNLIECDTINRLANEK